MKLPDRWLPYQSMGKQIRGTRFISFKVPLKKTFCDQLDEDTRFTPQMLMDNCPGVQLVIDLTNTNKYYDSRTFTDAGVAYKKILTPGHVIPSRKSIQEFFQTVDEFLASSEDDDSLIGVHCTHGLNRTSYFVCCYMIHQMGFDPEDAVAAFETARGHKIERLNYVEDLKKRGMGSDGHQAPPWASRNRGPPRHLSGGHQDTRARSSRELEHQQRLPPASNQRWPMPGGSANDPANWRQRPYDSAEQQYPNQRYPNQPNPNQRYPNQQNPSQRYAPQQDNRRYPHPGQNANEPYEPYKQRHAAGYQGSGARYGSSQPYQQKQHSQAGGFEPHQREQRPPRDYRATQRFPQAQGQGVDQRHPASDSGRRNAGGNSDLMSWLRE